MNNKKIEGFYNAEISDFQDLLSEYDLDLSGFIDLYTAYKDLSDESRIKILTAFVDETEKKEGE